MAGARSRSRPVAACRSSMAHVQVLRNRGKVGYLAALRHLADLQVRSLSANAAIFLTRSMMRPSAPRRSDGADQGLAARRRSTSATMAPSATSRGRAVEGAGITVHDLGGAATASVAPYFRAKVSSATTGSRTTFTYGVSFGDGEDAVVEHQHREASDVTSRMSMLDRQWYSHSLFRRRESSPSVSVSVAQAGITSSSSESFGYVAERARDFEPLQVSRLARRGSASRRWFPGLVGAGGAASVVPFSAAARRSPRSVHGRSAETNAPSWNVRRLPRPRARCDDSAVDAVAVERGGSAHRVGHPSDDLEQRGLAAVRR